jgi:hypothetical protein
VAQTNAPTITGSVLDPSGANVPDDAVQLQRPTGHTVPTVHTDVTGAFESPSLRRAHAVLIERAGFKVAVAQVRVSSRAVAPLTVHLELADLFSEVSAEFQPVQVTTEISENRDAAVVSQNLLENLPVLGQDYLSLMSRFLDAGSVGTRGASVVVDGMEVNNPGITASAIREVRINQNPYSAEFFRPGRGRIEIITKDAAAAYRTINFIFRDYYLNAATPT